MLAPTCMYLLQARHCSAQELGCRRTADGSRQNVQGSIYYLYSTLTVVEHGGNLGKLDQVRASLCNLHCVSTVCWGWVRNALLLL